MRRLKSIFLTIVFIVSLLCGQLQYVEAVSISQLKGINIILREDDVELEANVIGNTSGYEYKFVWSRVKDGEGDWSQWGVIRDFNASKTCRWKPKNMTGKYMIYMDVKDQSGDIKTVYGMWEMSLESQLKGINIILREDDVELGANVIGNTSGYEYKFVWSRVKDDKIDWSQWGVIRDFNASKTCRWKPKDMTGKYMIYMNVKDQSGDIKTVNGIWETSLKSQISGIRFGLGSAKRTIKSCVLGNKVGYKYKFVWVEVNEEGENWKNWGVIKAMDSSDTADWIPKNLSIDYKIYMDVMDQMGRTENICVPYPKELRKFFADANKTKVMEIPLSVPNVYLGLIENYKNIVSIKCDPKLLNNFNKSQLKQIAIQDGVKCIAKDTFKGCTNLEFLEIPLSVADIKDGAFEDCKWIGTLTCDPRWIGNFNKEAIIEFKIPNGVKVIPKESLSGCTNLRVVEIPNSVTTIEDGAFRNCKKLEMIKIPESVKYISPTAFDGCVNLKRVECTEEQRKQLETGLNVAYGTERMSSVDYEAYQNLEGIEIPTSVKSIDSSILKGFKRLKCIKCDPKWLKDLNKENLKVVIVPDGVKDITRSMFAGCTNLECLIIPDSVGNIEEGTFKGLNKLSCVGCNPKWLDKLDKSKIKTLLISDGTEGISKDDVQGCVNLESIVIPESVKNIEHDTFKNCKKLVNIKCDEKWNSIFSTKAIIPDGLTEIKKSEFENWINLKELVIPSSVKNIEPGTFRNCRNLEFVKCDPRFFEMIYKEQIKGLVIPEGIERVSREMLKGFSSLEYIELPDSVKTVDKDAFDDCTNLKAVRYQKELIKEISEKAKKECETVESPVVCTVPNYNFECSDDIQFVKEIANPADRIELTEFKPKETTVEDLVKVDPANAKYAEEVKKVLSATANKGYRGSDAVKGTSVCDIGDITAFVCNKIYWSDSIASKNGFRISPRPVQAMGIIRLADEIINGQGAIGEIKTGEGKSFIISVLGVVLSKYGRKIDIVTSNLELARRDEEDQRMYYELFGIGSGVLYNTKSEKDFMDGSRYVTSGAGDEKLESFNTDVFKNEIVYSTNGNFEFVYLHSLFRKKPLRDGVNRPYDVVLVDEVDNMFIDQESSPAIIARDMPLAQARDVLEIVYLMRNYEVEEIIEQLKQFFPECGNFNADNVGMLRKAARKAQDYEREVEYIIENGEIIIIDSNTGYKKPGSRWNNYIHEMVEIKEGLSPKSPSISYCEVTQRGYFNLYKKIAGVTGTVGTKRDEEQLKRAYGVNIFRVPRHFESPKIVKHIRRPGNIAEVYGLVYTEIMQERGKGRPVLVIMDSIQRVHEFCMVAGLNANTIEGTNPSRDREAIKVAGKAKQITIATSAAGRGMDIKLSEEAKKAGGLHVIIPMLMPNQRALEQAAGRSGRQGQPGSVSIYESPNDLFRAVPQFETGHDNLTKLELRFSEYLRRNHPWIYEGEGKYGLGELYYPYGTKVEEVVEITASRMSQMCFKNSEDGTKEPFKDLMLSMALVAWGTFFTDMSNHVEECADMSYCEAKYEGFLKDLGVWLDPGANTEDKAFAHIQKEKLKRVDWGEVAVIAGITVVSTGICILCPPATPWVIAGGVAAGALAEGGMEVYKESKTGEYDWRKILIKTLGGSLKGALAASPLKPLATGLGVATTGAIEDYIYCIANGETHEQALKSAAINGPIEGLTVGGCKWLGNAVANKVKVKKLPETNPKPISGELPEGTTGSLKINIQLFADKSFLTPQQMNQFELQVLEGKDIVFKSKEQALIFIKRKFPSFNEEVAGARSCEGWHFDIHPIGGSANPIEHINLYSKKFGFRVHITWEE